MPSGLTDRLTARPNKDTRELLALTGEELAPWLATQPATVVRWVKDSGFEAKPGQRCLLADESGGVARVLAGVESHDDPWAYAALPAALPLGRYRIDNELTKPAADGAALGWALGCYAFDRYKADERKLSELVWPKGADREAVARTAEAIALVRDLVTTPANDMGPAELASAAQALADRHRASLTVTVGEQLLHDNYPTIHAVGRASTRAPRLIDLRWGAKGPLIVVVGKGVCFDSGGLDLKPSAGMKLMKKDMGGGAHALGLASMIMAAKLPVRLRLLVPAVDNAVSGDAFRPLDVLTTRKGLTVEIGNTDAEGRLVLCDALAAAGEEEPALIVDFATLTGAARVALGPELPAMFCNDEETAAALLRHAAAERDPLWRLPLHQPYKKMLKSTVADLNNIGSTPFAGAITAALFLEHFVDPKTPWVHLDIFAWNPENRPGRPLGGEAMSLRAVYALIAERAGKRPSA